MSQIDQRTSNAIAGLRLEWSPPSGSEDRMLADFHARLGPPDGGGDGGELPSSGDGGALSGGATGQWLYVAKIIGAVAGLTAAGLGGVIVAAKLGRALDRPAPSREHSTVIVTSDAKAPVDVEWVAPTNVEPSPMERPPPPEATPATRSPSKPRVRREAQQVDLAAELALIQRARAAKPEQALALLNRHAREFPSGVLSTEREALRAAASCKLGRLDDARASVDRLVALDPGPLLRQRVQTACAEKIELTTTISARGGDSSP